MPTRLNAVSAIATAVALGAMASAAFLPHAAALPREREVESLRPEHPRPPRTPQLPDLEGLIEELERDRADDAPSIAEHIAATPPKGPESSAEEEPARSLAQTAVATARAQVGDPYRWGGTGPDSFDCSGLVRFAWKAAGVDLPRTSRAQFAALPRVDLDSLRPGDLVFSGYGRVTHVGMYVGDGRMVHSPNSGERVEVAPFHSNIIGAGRPAA